MVTAILDFRKSDFWAMGHLGLSLFHHCTKFDPIILSEDEITAQNRNPRWRPSAILDFRKPDFLAMGPIVLAIFYPGTKFGAKMLIDIEIMAQNRNPRWRPSAILDFENLISENCNPLGCWFSILVQNLVQKCWSTPKLWPKIEIQDGGRPPSWICHIII